MSRVSYTELLQAEVQRRGVRAVAKRAGVRQHLVRRFLHDYGDIRISTLARIARACDMPTGEFHLIDVESGRCVTCGRGKEEHPLPLFPEGTSTNRDDDD